MSEKKTKNKINTEENEKLQTQIDASIGLTRSLIESWFSDVKDDDNEAEDEKIMTSYSTGRPDRLGLGAKYLSHAEAMRHHQPESGSSKEVMELRNKILHQNKKVGLRRDEGGKRFRQLESDDEEESRSSVGQPKKKVAVSTAGKKKIGPQGDFLSMYLNERAAKKKKK